jgi:hypothetical protein
MNVLQRILKRDTVRNNILTVCIVYNQASRKFDLTHEMPGRVPSHVESLSWQITKGELIEDIHVITQMGIGNKTRRKQKLTFERRTKMKELIAVVAVIILGIAVGGVIVGFQATATDIGTQGAALVDDNFVETLGD